MIQYYPSASTVSCASNLSRHRGWPACRAGFMHVRPLQFIFFNKGILILHWTPPIILLVLPAGFSLHPLAVCGLQNFVQSPPPRTPLPHHPLSAALLLTLSLGVIFGTPPLTLLPPDPCPNHTTHSRCSTLAYYIN